MIKKQKGIARFMVSAIMVCAFLCIASNSALSIVSVSIEHKEAGANNVGILIINSSNSFVYYDSSNLRDFIIDGVNMPTQTSETLSSVNFASETLNIIYIITNNVLLSLSDSDKAQLKTLYTSGYPVGVFDDPSSLKSILGVNDSVSIPYKSDVELIHFLYDNNGHTIEYSTPWVYNIHDMAGEVVGWAGSLFNLKNSSNEKRISGAWDSDYTKEWEGTLDGGSYRLLLNVYKFDDNSSTYDWYLYEFSIQTSISDYSCSASSSECGWFSTDMDLKVEVTNGGSLYDYMPTGDVGSTSESYSIGASLDTSALGVSASYSKSYSISDATYADKSSFTDETAYWQIDFNGPDYSWYPISIDEPPTVAQGSYKTEPAMIAQVDEGDCSQVTIYPTVKQESDTDIHIYWFSVKWTSTTNWWYDTDTYGGIDITVCD